MIASAGARKPHVIVAPEEVPESGGARVLRVALLLMCPLEKLLPEYQSEALRVTVEVKAAGHDCVTVVAPPGKDGGTTGHLARLVERVGAEAWLVFGGTREIMHWFAGSGLPVFALGGIIAERTIAVAATYDLAAIGRKTAERLLALGHRRIVFICRRGSRHPVPSSLVRAVREELQAAGVKPGEYNTPEWEETPEGLEALLSSLFRYTPPTAIVGVSAQIAAGTLGFLARAGLAVPGDVSVVSLSRDDAMPAWVFPGVTLAHVESDDAPVYRRLREWVGNIARGETDRRRIICPAQLVEGTTIGPAKGAKAR